MATPSLAPNPFTGSSWDAANGPSGGAPPPSMLNTQVGAPLLNPGNFGNPTGGKEVNRNIILSNQQNAALKNKLAPQFAALMSQYGGNAGQFFQNLMNLGSPYYKQQQEESFTQGVQQNKNAEAGAEDQIRAQGYGSTPSGANAAMIGGMEQEGAQSLAEQYLQNLFQNEQMQFAGAQGEQGLAQLFNPTQLLGGTSAGADSVISPSFFQDLNQTLTGIGAAASGQAPKSSGG